MTETGEPRSHGYDRAKQKRVTVEILSFRVANCGTTTAVTGSARTETKIGNSTATGSCGAALRASTTCPPARPSASTSGRSVVVRTIIPACRTSGSKRDFSEEFALLANAIGGSHAEISRLLQARDEAQ